MKHRLKKLEELLKQTAGVGEYKIVEDVEQDEAGIYKTVLRFGYPEKEGVE